MKRLSRYIGVTMMQSIALMLVAFAGLQLFIDFMNQLKDVGTGNYTLWQATIYILLTLPSEVYHLFPMAGMMGCLVGLGVLAANSELIVMQAAGVSLLRITGAVIKTAVLLIILAVFIGEGIAPELAAWANARQTIAKSGGQAVSTQEGVWLRQGDTFVHIGLVLADGSLRNIDRFKFDDQQQLIFASFAQTGHFSQGQWVLQQLRDSWFQPDHITTRNVASENWQAELDPKILSESHLGPQEMPLLKLYRYIQYGEVNQINTDDYALAFWQRIFQPLASIVMMLLAIPFIFGPLRSVSMGLRLLTGIFVGIGFYLLNQFFGPFSLVYQFPPLLAALTPTLLFLGLGCLMLRRLR